MPTVTIDGWRIEFPDGWGLIRASNTQPALTLRFEGAQESDLDTLLRVFDEALQPHLGTPSATRNRIGRADR